MPRKNSTVNHLINTLKSSKSTPDQIQKAFNKYIESIRSYYKCNRANSSQEDYEDNIRALDAFKSWINSTMFTKINRLESKNQYQSEITQLHQILGEITLAYQECNIGKLNFNMVNGILQKNGIKILGTQKRYSSYHEAFEAASLQNIQDGEYSLPRSVSFYEPEPEEGECSNRRNL
ncbi:5918_t:CDS:2 [Racocetra fulgida]|uniref:5918_t:CDS:1 n=1 Tax=Racocetra fulgida TaxID=60492 RepID=A0A9N8Z525_9GLOM|nr:5918_t:CDS:2 [Racocetra fulgida]